MPQPTMTTAEAAPGDEGRGSASLDVTILMCTRNRAAQLKDALDALGRVKSKLAWEAVILDNGSTDGTADVIRAAAAANPRLRYAFEAQPGLGAARDSGWRLARGRIVSLTDDDCYVQPGYVDAVGAAFAEHPDVGVLGGRLLLFDPDDAPLTIDTREVAEATPPFTAVRTSAFHGANLSFRREALAKAGGFDRALGAGTPFPAEDVDAVARVLWAGFAGRFDPRPVILHHHRRKTADMAPQVRRFDVGRGAYYAKFILRKDTRSAYIRDWLDRAGPFLAMKRPWQSAAETLAAMRYTRAFGSAGQQATWLPVFAFVHLTARLQHALHAIRNRLPGGRAANAADVG